MTAVEAPFRTAEEAIAELHANKEDLVALAEMSPPPPGAWIEHMPETPAFVREPPE